MIGLAQLNLTESAFIPDELSGISMITIFLAEGDGWFLDPSGRANDDGWVLRTYGSTEDLVAADGPVFDGIRPRQLDWDVVDDYPAWDDLVTAVGYDRVESILRGRDPSDVIGVPAEGPKLGGWPSTIQGEVIWAPWNQHPASPNFCVQIDADRATNLTPLGSGVLYVGLGNTDGVPVWLATTQFP